MSNYENELADDVNKPLSLSSRLLSQAEGAGIDFYTINFARLAAKNIGVGTKGQRLYNHCLTNLPIHRSNDFRLQFGWGEQHILRNMGVQLYEYEHLLLASAMGEYFSEDYTTAVHSALADKIEDDDRPKPHLSSLQGFIHSANGILATSDFPLVVDDRIRLNPYRLNNDGLPFSKQPQETLSVEKLADALSKLGALKQGSASSLELAGGDVLGWFSAFADLCLGIDVTLTDANGNELHRANPGQEAGVKLRFVPMEARPPASPGSVIWLREERLCKPVLTVHSALHTGRLTPHSLLNKTFGTAFHLLDQTEARTFANALGGAARAFELAATDDKSPTQIISCENRSNTRSWGLGLIETWSNWFPELRRLQGRMERALKLDLPATNKQCDDSVMHLENLCGCYICSPTEGTEEHPTNLPREGFCIPTLMETILMLGLALSRVALTPDLYPSRAGVLAMYKSQCRKRQDLKKSHIDRNDVRRFILLFGEDFNSTLPKRLANVIALFSGSWPRKEFTWPKLNVPDNLVGISHHGICAYAMILERGDKRPKHVDDHVIRVLTGSINWRQKTWSRICLGPPELADFEFGWDSIECEHFKEKLYAK